MTKLRTLALVGALCGMLMACAPDDGHQGGGGGPPAGSGERLPDSNNVNPSPEPDSYIDEEAKQREEREERKTREDRR